MAVEKIKVKEITVHYGTGSEGTSIERQTFTSFKDANNFLSEKALIVPERDDFDRCRFDVVWEDGNKHSEGYVLTQKDIGKTEMIEISIE